MSNSCADTPQRKSSDGAHQSEGNPFASAKGALERASSTALTQTTTGRYVRVRSDSRWVGIALRLGNPWLRLGQSWTGHSKLVHFSTSWNCTPDYLNAFRGGIVVVHVHDRSRRRLDKGRPSAWAKKVPATYKRATFVTFC